MVSALTHEILGIASTKKSVGNALSRCLVDIQNSTILFMPGRLMVW
jgi:hypothetical protein